MGLLHGIVARIMVGDEKDAGTDDDVYLGLFGKGGGCEFPLDTRRDDFLTGRLTKMHFGVVWEGEQLNGSLIAHGQSDVPYEHHLNGQTPSGHNSPGARQVDIDLIEYVYIRKLTSKKSNNDDALCIANAQIRLYGEEPILRIFEKDEAFRLGQEYGAQVWLREIV